MAGVGETGVWQTGVWVTPLDFEGEFILTATGELTFTGRFSFAGRFNLEGATVLLFDGAQVGFGEFTLDPSGDLAFDGQFVPNPGQGVFQMEATANVVFAWVPRFDFPGSEVGIPDDPAQVIIKTKPGDIVVIGGATGTVILDDVGRLVVIDHAGEVLCILGPGGVEL